MKFCFAELSGIKKMKDYDITQAMESFYNQLVTDKLILTSNKSKDELRNMIINNIFLTKELGNTRMKHLKNNSLLIFSTEHMEQEKQLEINRYYKEIKDVKIVNRTLDAYYEDMMFVVQKLSILFSTGMWLVKDSNIQPMHIYLATSVNNYVSVFNIKLDYSDSYGKNSQISVSDNDIINCKKMMNVLYEPLLDIQNSENKKPSQIYVKDSNYYEVNRKLSTINPSFTKTLMFIQEARNTSFLPSKIDKYIAAIQCIFAVKDNFTFNCSRIAASYISNNNSERKEIIEFVSKGYYVRSQVSHGKQVDEKKYSLEKISNRLDAYIRRIMKKVLGETELNYFTLEEEQKVRKYFKDIARKEFENDYSGLKKSNRIDGVKKNIESITDLDALIDLEEIIKQQIDKLL